MNVILHDPAPADEQAATPDRWAYKSACRTTDADAMFGTVAEQQTIARTLCAGCPVRTTCLGYALQHHVEWGVWGGLIERERRTLLRDHPDVPSWATLLEELGGELSALPKPTSLAEKARAEYRQAAEGADPTQKAALLGSMIAAHSAGAPRRRDAAAVVQALLEEHAILTRVPVAVAS